MVDQVYRVFLPMLKPHEYLPQVAYAINLLYKICKPKYVMGKGIAGNRYKARKRAIRNWRYKVKSKYGVAWSKWKIAANKKPRIRRISNSKWKARAKARPCKH